MAKEYIRRDVANTILLRGAAHCLTHQKEGEARGFISAKDLLGKIPAADVVEIVRCRDCKHQRKQWHEDKRRKAKGYYVFWCDKNQNTEGAHSVNGEDNDFCSRGERRDDDD